jgi:hypothetical protein
MDWYLLGVAAGKCARAEGMKLKPGKTLILRWRTDYAAQLERHQQVKDYEDYREFLRGHRDGMRQGIQARRAQ